MARTFMIGHKLRDGSELDGLAFVLIRKYRDAYTDEEYRNEVSAAERALKRRIKREYGKAVRLEWEFGTQDGRTAYVGRADCLHYRFTIAA